MANTMTVRGLLAEISQLSEAQLDSTIKLIDNNAYDEDDVDEGSFEAYEEAGAKPYDFKLFELNDGEIGLFFDGPGNSTPVGDDEEEGEQTKIHG